MRCAEQSRSDWFKNENNAVFGVFLQRLSIIASIIAKIRADIMLCAIWIIVTDAIMPIKEIVILA